jgi:hypothetical protein
MIPSYLEALFWDTDLASFEPGQYPDFTIFRVLEYGDERALAWLREAFPESEIRRVLRSERRLSRKSANFWALVFGVPFREVAALNVSG